MNRKHKKAIKISTIVLLICLVPLLYLRKLHQENIILDVDGFGVVPEFQFMFRNSDFGMTAADTERHSTVVVIAGDYCQSSCPKLVDAMNRIRAFYKESLRGKQSDPNTPPGTRFIVHADSGWENLPNNWDFVLADEDTPILVPRVKADGPFPAFVLIDDGSFYRGFVPLSDPQLFDKISRELVRMTSGQYLMHYVNRQTLMWKKAKGRELKAQPEASH